MNRSEKVKINSSMRHGARETMSTRTAERRRETGRGRRAKHGRGPPSFSVKTIKIIRLASCALRLRLTSQGQEPPPSSSSLPASRELMNRERGRKCWKYEHNMICFNSYEINHDNYDSINRSMSKSACNKNNKHEHEVQKVHRGGASFEGTKCAVTRHR